MNSTSRVTRGGDVTKWQSLEDGSAWKGSNLPKTWTLLPDRAHRCQPGWACALLSSAKAPAGPHRAEGRDEIGHGNDDRRAARAWSAARGHLGRSLPLPAPGWHRALAAWCHVPGGSAAREELSERGQPRRDSLGRASRYIPGAGAQGTGWARSEGAKHKPGLAPCGPGVQPSCGRAQPVPAVPARPAKRPQPGTFEALLVQHDCVVLGGLRQAEELASEEEEIGAADPKTAAVSRRQESGEEEGKEEGGGGRKAGTGSAGAGRAA